jgi:hypothetical protein
MIAWLLDAGYSSKIFIHARLILPTVLRENYEDHHHFTDGQTEAQSISETC